jgi:Zn-dependent protease with chaperone function
LEYSNPKIPEGINTSNEHPLKEFFWLTSAVLSLAVVVLLLLVLFADSLTAYIPFSVEKKLSLPEFPTSEPHSPLSGYLQSMADRIVKAENLPEEMTITVHYLDDDTMNAFATLGGHVYFYRGLLEKLHSENALAMLMAHEIAHIKYRHPIRSLGRGVIAALAISVISSSAGDAIVDRLIGGASTLTILKFSRGMEEQADSEAMDAVEKMYGGLHGADALFRVLQKEASRHEPPAFFSTHPLTRARIKAVTQRIQSSPDLDGNRITPLPEDFSKWLTPRQEQITASDHARH